MFGWFRRRRRGPDPDAIGQRARELQQRYWTRDADERRALLKRFPDGLGWPERLRLHHLACLELIGEQPLDGDGDDAGEPGPSSDEAVELVQRTTRLLLQEASPYRPRLALVHQGQGEVGEHEPPDLQGLLYNASLTHLGAVEVVRTDEEVNPTELAFVPLDELHLVALPLPPSGLRAAVVVYEDQREERALAPLLYGLSWRSTASYDTDGSMTRFVCHVAIEEAGALGLNSHLGVGLGQQDLAVAPEEGGQTLFGLGSVRQLAFPLIMDDPRFDERCRLRGIDPDMIRRMHGEDEGN